MCGRYNLITDAEALIDFFEIDQVLVEAKGLHPRYNIAPGQSVPIIRNAGQGNELLLARWGLIPHWSREPSTKYSTINARAETVAEKPSYRDAFKRKRCLIPANGFYEWKSDGDKKTPHHIHAPDNSLLAFAGVWDHWDRQGEGFDSCSIIVTTASRIMQPIHARMPVILNPAQYSTWLNPAHYNRAQLESMLVPYAGSLETCRISRFVNSPANDGPECVEPDSG
ncbi:MAG: SOS response-associated peptidase [Thiogranum sp.]